MKKNKIKNKYKLFGKIIIIVVVLVLRFIIYVDSYEEEF